MENYILMFWRKIRLLPKSLFLISIVLFCSAGLTSSEETKKYSPMPDSKAEQIIKDLIDNGNYPDSGLTKLTAPTSNLDIKGVLINEKDFVIIAKIKPGITEFFTNYFTLPPDFVGSKGVAVEFSDGHYHLNYLLVISTDLKLTSNKLYSMIKFFVLVFGMPFA